MSKSTNTVPYTNARRAGRTNPDLVEMLSPSDPRRLGVQYVPNRADRRAQHHGSMTRKGASARRLYRPVWPPVPTDADWDALIAFRARRTSVGGYYCPCGFRMWWGKGDTEHYAEIESHEALCTWRDEEVSA